MKILFIGDIVGSPGRNGLKKALPAIKKEFGIDFVIANAENAAGGSGITEKTAEELLQSGVDVLTSGDHIWKKNEIIPLIEREKRILRPANFPQATPGRGAEVFTLADGRKVGVVNLLGRVFMDPIDCPFNSAGQAVEALSVQTRVIIVDMHAEATSEKVALGWFLDGKVSAVLGTHTHVQTADERILPKGTAYISDVGMTGSQDSVIGRRVEDVLHRFITGLPVRFEVAEENVRVQGVALEIDDVTGKAKGIIRVNQPSA
jgi:metallophosphoesterase (TIGR00282 family)